MRKHPLALCEEWQGAVSSTGYGTIHGGEDKRYVHRLVWEEANGPIPNDYQIHHICGNRLCIRLEHLELVHRLEHSTIHHRHKVCRNGHPRTPDNIRIINHHEGPRYECIECRRARGVEA